MRQGQDINCGVREEVERGTRWGRGARVRFFYGDPVKAGTSSQHTDPSSIIRTPQVGGLGTRMLSGTKEGAGPAPSHTSYTEQAWASGNKRELDFRPAKQREILISPKRCGSQKEQRRSEVNLGGAEPGGARAAQKAGP